MSGIEHCVPGPRALGWLLLAALPWCSLAVARAQPPPEQPAAPEPPPEQPAAPEPSAPEQQEPAEPPVEEELSAEELAEIQAALGADAKARAPAASSAPSDDGKGSWVDDAAVFLPDMSLVLDLALAYFSDDEPLQDGGHDPTETGFNLQQLEMSLSKSVDPYFRFDANIVFSLFGVEIEEAYVTTTDLPLDLQLRAGQLLTRFGRINSSHPHSWSFADQPFMWSKVFGGEGNRALGVELSWLSPLPWYVELLGSVSGAAGESTARSFYGDDDQGVHSPLDFQSTGAIKQFFDLSEDWSLMWGLSAATGPNPSGKGTRSDVYGTDLYLKYRPITRASYTTVSLQAEWLYRRRQLPLDLVQDSGGYVELFWRFAKRWGTAARYEHGSAPLNLDGNRTVDPLDPDQTEARHRGTLANTFWPTEFSRLRLQGSADFPGWRPQPILAAFLAFEVVVGAHGAHKF